MTHNSFGLLTFNHPVHLLGPLFRIERRLLALNMLLDPTDEDSDIRRLCYASLILQSSARVCMWVCDRSCLMRSSPHAPHQTPYSFTGIHSNKKFRALQMISSACGSL